MALVKTNGIEIEYEDQGPADAPVVFLLQGLAMQLIAWPDEMVNFLLGAGYRVIRMDNRDAGLSTKFTGMPNPVRLGIRKLLGLKNDVRYRLEDMAADSVGLLDVLGVKSAHIVGVSMGGMISQLLTALHPERVLSLTSVMSASGRLGYSLPTYRVRFRMIKRPASSSRADRVKNMMGIWRMIGSPGYPKTDESLKAWCERNYDRSYNPGGAVRQIGAILENGSRVAHLKKIKTPTLVIHGTEDVLVPTRGGVDTARQIPGAKLEIIEGMGHDLPVELCEYLSQLMVEHFREAVPAAVGG